MRTRWTNLCAGQGRTRGPKSAERRTHSLILFSKKVVMNRIGSQDLSEISLSRVTKSRFSLENHLADIKVVKFFPVASYLNSHFPQK